MPTYDGDCGLIRVSNILNPLSSLPITEFIERGENFEYNRIIKEIHIGSFPGGYHKRSRPLDLVA